MIIEIVTILNFKNIEEGSLSFSPKINYLLGDNGMGKTNLLDALYYLAFTKNHTNLTDSQLINYNKDFAVLHAFYKDKDNIEEIYCGIKLKQRKIFKRNKKEYKKLSEHIGLIPTVMVSPNDTNMIQFGSNERRKFADMLISQYDKEYLRTLIYYNQALQQRNFLLRNALPSLSGEEFEIWEEQMGTTGEIIYQKRKNFTTDFLPLFKEYYYTISDKNETIDLEYVSHLDDHSLFELLYEKRERDKILGFTSTGIHKDDFNFLLNNFLIRKIGSQGQNKTYLIALKLAQFSFLVQKGLSIPILLLDDLFDKLDAKRVEKIIRLLAQKTFGQIFITDTNRKHLDNILTKMQHAYKLFYVSNGTIREIL
ncbi:DNA replication/repair protein RecF [Candidatus Azobacteroides pseudotrichonymphae]|uniref:DNA replication and repair protein RecF n=1 Tax=Azobacteroides pseudotrichonymphae genomovar. CFP2 TaxID=511995 RepID=RECF_AZOPC|nr:DNA replication and repair protein RecF [Candidatus Azobacteroides pseudotrichonymphae]B6YRR8.1 RecName: Full=DNA replication and repair protein RecF [Candidatus Azobacteroides pseudotrichonymphae genomovar. CFP2]BAG83890.1 DNA replication and repair protein RecF [Candidatus Azobacteroides pseudotrichonymphae genomovar. CFP2]